MQDLRVLFFEKIKGSNLVLVKEKIDILAHIFNNPNTCLNQLHNYLIQNSQSRKTTSTIYKYVNELHSAGYLRKFDPLQKNLFLTRKGHLLLESYKRNHGGSR